MNHRTPKPAPRSLELPAGEIPVARLKSVPRSGQVFRKMLGEVDATAGPGDLVRLVAPQGEPLGFGLYNPRAEMPIRAVSRGTDPPDTAFWQQRMESAVRLRREWLNLDAVADAYRVIHAEADGFPGLVVDRYGDVLSAEVFSLAMYQRIDAFLALLAPLVGTRHTLVRIAPQTHGQEGFQAEPAASPDMPQSIDIEEHGTQFRVDFQAGHKTGFFCDQRDNRRQLAELARGRTVVDLCAYSGGFAVQALKLGQAKSAVGVDLDEDAIALAKTNAKLNGVKAQFVQADVFGWMRDAIQNERTFDVVALDPPKLIKSRRELDEGTRKHLDLNRLAIQLVAPGGLFLSCTCSGLLTGEAFDQLLHTAARQAGNKPVQILARTGAAPDHPVGMDSPETEYLHATWMRVSEQASRSA